MRHYIIELDELDYELWTNEFNLDWRHKPPNKSNQRIFIFLKQKVIEKNESVNYRKSILPHFNRSYADLTSFCMIIPLP